MQQGKHEGKLLTEYLAAKGISQQEVCDKLNITHHAYIYHSNCFILSGKFKAMLLSNGISLFENENEEHRFLMEYTKELEEKVIMLSDVIELQKQFITHVTKHCHHGSCLNFVLNKKTAEESHSDKKKTPSNN